MASNFVSHGTLQFTIPSSSGLCACQLPAVDPSNLGAVVRNIGSVGVYIAFGSLSAVPTQPNIYLAPGQEMLFQPTDTPASATVMACLAHSNTSPALVQFSRGTSHLQESF